MSNNSYKLKSSCPVCGGAGKHCVRTINDLIFCYGYKKNEVNLSSEWKYIRDNASSIPMFGKRPTISTSGQGFKKVKPAKLPKALQPNRIIHPLTYTEFDREYRKLLTQSPELWTTHKEDLDKRGLGVNYHSSLLCSIGTVKVEGLSDRFPGQTNGKLGFYGMTIPAFTYDGKVIGFQLKTQNADCKYIWTPATVKEGNEFRSRFYNPETDSDEMPISIVNLALSGLDYNPNIVLLTEGMLKPMVAAYRHGVSAIGLGGNSWASYSHQIELAKSEFRKANPEVKIYLAPDAGSLKNNHVRQMITNALEAGLVDGMLDWGQLWDKSMDDPDEVTDIMAKSVILSVEEALTECGFAEETNQPKGYIVEDNGSFHGRPRKQYVPGTLTLPDLHDYAFTIAPSQRTKFYFEAMKRGVKSLLDASAPGTGKTHGLKEFLAIAEAPQVWYLSANHRNPPTEYIETEFTELSARHNGLTIDKTRQNPSGSPYRRRAGKDDAILTPANCINADQFVTARNNNIDAKELKICKSCPFLDQCRAGSGDGFGFLYQIKEDLKKGNIRANVRGVSPSMVQKRSIVIVDEVSQASSPVKIISVSPSEVFKLNLTDSNVDRELFNFQTAIAAQCNRGQATSDVAANLIYAMPSNTKGLWRAEELEYKQIESAAEKIWLSVLLRVLMGKERGMVWVDGGQLKIGLVESNLSKIIEQSQFTVYLDASISEEKLDWLVGERSLAVCEVMDTSHENTTLISVEGLQSCRNNRTNATKELIAALKDEIKSKYKDCGVVEYKQFAEDGDVVWFSDSRGSNRFINKDALILVGRPLSHIDTYYDYVSLSGKWLDEETWSQLYQSNCDSEIVQAIGRVRANRRPNERIDIWCMDNKSFDLSKFGFTTLNCQFKMARGKARIRTNQESLVKTALIAGIKHVNKLLSGAKRVKLDLSAKEIGLSRANLVHKLRDFKGIEGLRQIVMSLTSDHPLPSYLNQATAKLLDLLSPRELQLLLT